MIILFPINSVAFQEGITEIIEDLNLGEKKEELIKIIDAHFDPEKSPMKPARNANSNRRGGDFRSRKGFRLNGSGSVPGNNSPSVVEVKN